MVRISGFMVIRLFCRNMERFRKGNLGLSSQLRTQREYPRLFFMGDILNDLRVSIANDSAAPRSQMYVVVKDV